LTAFVLVHGAYHGGWCWRDVAARLTAQGHRVFTPTLTGLGERAHLATPQTDLQTHIQDVVAVFDCEDIDGAVLVGHSYGGMVIGGVADCRRERIRALVFVDAVIPEDGKSVIDFQTPERAAALLAAAEDNDGWRMPAIPAAVYGVTDPDQAAWVDAKCAPHPIATFRQPSYLTGAWLEVPRKTYIRCTQTPLSYMDAFAERAANDADWSLYYLETGHDCMVTEPERLAAMLMAQL
jgi:pimeloyl-ACP methyl ester carboxylesterase